MKKILIILLSTILIMVSCTKISEEKIVKKLEKTVEKSQGYSCITETIIEGTENQSIYLMRETYVKPKIYELEILEPIESKGITIRYEEDKVYLKHATIDQSLSLKGVKTMGEGLLLSHFFENLGEIRFIGVDEIDKVEYVIFEMDFEEKNKFNNFKRIWFKKKDFTPHMLNIINEDNEIRVKVIYKDFEYSN